MTVEKRDRKACAMLQFPVEIAQLIQQAYFKRHVAPPLLHANLSKRLIATLQKPPISDDPAFNFLSGYIHHRHFPIKDIEELLRAVIPTSRFLQLFQSIIESLEAGVILEGKEIDFETRAECLLVLIQAAARNQLKREHR